MTPKKKKLKRKQWIGLVFIAPWLIGLIGLQVYPFVASLFSEMDRIGQLCEIIYGG